MPPRSARAGPAGTTNEARRKWALARAITCSKCATILTAVDWQRRRAATRWIGHVRRLSFAGGLARRARSGTLSTISGAKVILTVRDPNEWYNSVQKTIVPFITARGTHGSAHINGIADMGHETVFVRFSATAFRSRHAIAYSTTIA
jgi:hypothetical protein